MRRKRALSLATRRAIRGGLCVVVVASLSACGAKVERELRHWTLDDKTLGNTTCVADKSGKMIRIKDGKKVRCRKASQRRDESSSRPQRSGRSAPRQSIPIYSPRTSRAPPFGPKISARLRDISPAVFARLLSLSTGETTLADARLTTPISGSFDKTPRLHALQTLATLYGWHVLHRDHAIVIRPQKGKDAAPQEHASATASELLSLRYIEPKMLQEMVTRLFSGKGEKPLVVVNPQAREVVVQGSAQARERIRLLADKIDIPTRQIFIEAFIIEAGDDFERRLGSRLGYDLRSSNLRVAGVAEAPTADGLRLGERGGSIVDLAAPGAVGGIGFLVDRNRLKLELTALEREGTTRIISNPRVFTLDSQRATVFQGDEIPYLSVSDEGTQTQFREAGVKLEVTPTVIGEGRLLIRVRINKDSVDTRQTNPAITRRSIETSLIVADGAMAVIGGIYFNTEVNSSSRLPWFGRLPVIGRIFRNTNKQLDARELLILLLPTVV